MNSDFESLFILDSMNKTFVEMRDCIIKWENGVGTYTKFDLSLEFKRAYTFSTIDQVNNEIILSYLRNKTNQPDLNFKATFDEFSDLNLSKLMAGSCKSPPSIRLYSWIIK